jgi:flagellar biosynthesis chaperone FliJ
MVVYPLKQILEIKKRRVDEAERVVLEKRRALEQEEQRLVEAEAAREKVRQHKKDKMEQLRQTLDEGTTSPKIMQMKAYLKVVQEKLAIEDKKVKDQKGKVELAAKDLEDAKAHLRLKRLEVDKVEAHKVEWTKEQRKEAEIKEESEMNEVGTVAFLIHRKQMDSYRNK